MNRLAAGGRDPQRLGWARVVDDLAARVLGRRTRQWHVVERRTGMAEVLLLATTFPWAAVDGMVNPFGLEVVINPEVLPFERPFVLAHEWAHLAGLPTRAKPASWGCWRA